MRLVAVIFGYLIMSTMKFVVKNVFAQMDYIGVLVVFILSVFG
ncbi:hypothetical protein EV145_103357 [Flavobacterium sp. 245]|nr:hypothetical protein EV145_103357 [Flavobacterium sp. 245]